MAGTECRLSVSLSSDLGTTTVKSENIYNNSSFDVTNNSDEDVRREREIANQKVWSLFHACVSTA